MKKLFVLRHLDVTALPGLLNYLNTIWRSSVLPPPWLTSEKPTMTPDSAVSERSGSSAQETGLTAETVFVEVKILCDPRHHRHSHFKKPKEALVYLAVSLFSVNLRYAALTGPAVQFLLTGVILLANYSHVVTVPPTPDGFVSEQVGYLDSEGSLKKLSYHFQTKQLNVTADVILFVTGLDMLIMQNYNWNPKIHGLAYVSAICTATRIAIVEDTPGDYRMIDIATHELGHSCGSEHDGDWKRNNFCNPHGGWIMSPVGRGARNTEFSECSKNRIRHFMRTLTASCVFVSSSVNRLANVTHLPGTGMSTSSLCKARYPYGDNRDTQDETYYPDCKASCLDNNQHKVQENLLDGMQCDGTKICLKGECRNKPEDLFPVTKKTATKKRAHREKK
ncbi:venom metalloproteinase antarease-like TtrivMP_A [Ixodes scapularis]